MSDKAKEGLRIWIKVKTERMQKLSDKFGYIPCEHCLKRIIEGSGLYGAEAHHNNHDRQDGSFQNCRIVHAYCNRVLIEDNNIKDVPSLL